MDFNKTVKTSNFDILVESYFDGKCSECGSKSLKIRSSYKRTLQDLGAPREKRMVHLKVNYYECETCGNKFSPKHPEYPGGYIYTSSVITYALDSYYQFNASVPQIALELKKRHHVDIPKDTIYMWIKKLSNEYLPSITHEKILNNPEEIKTITIDGTHVSVGRDVVGKKKRSGLLWVTKQEDGTYLLMWSKKKLWKTPPEL